MDLYGQLLNVLSCKTFILNGAIISVRESQPTNCHQDDIFPLVLFRVSTMYHTHLLEASCVL